MKRTRQPSAGHRMKQAYLRTKKAAADTKNSVSRPQFEDESQKDGAHSPALYAEDKISKASETIVDKTAQVAQHSGKKLAQKTRQKAYEKAQNAAQGGETTTETASETAQPTADAVREMAKPSAGTGKPVRSNSGASGKSQEAAPRTSNRSSGETHGSRTIKRTASLRTRAPDKTARANRQSAAISPRAASHNLKTGAQNTAKTTTKTARKTASAATKTAKTTAMTVKTSARAAKRAAQASKLAAKAAAVTVKAAAKVAISLAKAVAATVKGIAAAIAAGGGVVVLIIIIVLLVGAVLGSVFGIFATDKGYDSAPSMSEVVTRINGEHADAVTAIIETTPHDRLEFDGGAGANWTEVLAVYAVLVATDIDNPMEVATLDDAKIQKLRDVFFDMNVINYSTYEVVTGYDEETGTEYTETVLSITVTGKTAEDMIAEYGFNDKQAEQLRELLNPEYAELFALLIGGSITLSAAEIAEIMATLPDNLCEERLEVVLTAYSLLGKVNYFWGGKSLVIGWDSRWGTPTRVTADDSSSTGTIRPFGLDCSGFADWVFYNAYDGGYIIGHGGGATSQYGYCAPIDWSDAQPGDLAFYSDCEHVGIVVQNEAGILAVIHCASGYNNVVMTQHTQGSGFSFVGRPVVYTE